MGKSCTCCKSTCPKCAVCDRIIKSFDFKFSNKNPNTTYEVNVPVNQFVNQPCLKYFYIGDATGYYRQDTRIPYKFYQMEIKPTRGTTFSKDLIACNKNRNRLGQPPYFSDNDTIVTSQKINGSIVITFPDERFFANQNSIYQVRFLYGNNKKMEFYFNPWNFQDFQNQLRNYEFLDASLVGKYPELKDCNVILRSYDLPQEPSLNLSVIDANIECRANYLEYSLYSYIHRRRVCSSGCLGELTYDSKELTNWIWPGFLYLHRHATYKKTYHGFLIVLSPNISCEIFPNISEKLIPYRDGDTRVINKRLKVVGVTSNCREDPTCFNGASTECIGGGERGEIIQNLYGEGSFDGDMSVQCPSCRSCVDVVNIRRTASKPTTVNSEGSIPLTPISSDFTIKTLTPETTWDTSICCCVGKTQEIVKRKTYFDFAFSYGSVSFCENPTISPIFGLSCLRDGSHPGFNYSACSELSIASEAQVKLNFEDLLNVNANESQAGGPTKPCISPLPGQFFQYTLGAIPLINEFELIIGTSSTYTLKGSTDFSSDNTPDQWVGNSSDFIGATNEYQTGIRDCLYYDDNQIPLPTYRDSRINKSIEWIGLNENFNSISSINTRFRASWFLSQETKSLGEIPNRTLQYKKQTGQAIKFIDRINANPNSDLYFLPHTVDFLVRPVFLTNLVKDPRGDYLPPLSLLKMYIELIIGPYVLRSATININNTNDIYSTFIIDQEVGIYRGSILDPGGIRFVRDPVFSRPMLVSLK